MSRDLPTFDRDIVRGPIHRSVWKIAWPTLTANLVAGLQGVIDHAMVGRFVGYEGNAGIGISWQIFIVLVVFVSSLYTGMGVLVARLVGAGEEHRVDRVIYQAFLVSAFLGLGVFAPIGYLLSPAFLSLVNATPAVQAQALPYLQTLFLYCTGMLLFFMLGGALRAAGDAQTPMRLGILMTSLNIVLTIVLVPGVDLGAVAIPALGTEGAGLATVGAAGAADLVALYLLFRRRLVIRLRPGSSWGPQWKIIRAILHFGLPSGVQGIAINLGSVLLIRYVGALESSAEAQAVYTVAFAQLFSLINWTAVAVMAATATVAGQSFGAGQIERTFRAPISASMVGLSITVPLGLLFVFIPRPLLGIFGMEDPRLLALGEQLLGYLSLSSVFLTVALAYTGALQGTGDTRSPLVITLVSQLFLPLGLCSFLDLSGQLTPAGIWIAVVLGHLARAALSVFVFQRGQWRAIEIDLTEGFTTHHGIPRPSRSQILQESAIIRPGVSARQRPRAEGGRNSG